MTKTNKQLRKVASYLRRSDKGQEASIVDQRKANKEYAARHNLDIVKEYVDDGISGDDTKKRLGFLRMREDAATSEFEAVLCWDQDRFGRFDSLEAGHWIYPFRESGVSLITLSDGEIDWNTFAGRMIYGMKQEGKHQFLRDLSRNVLRGQTEAAQAGSWCGTAPYAYRIEGAKKQKRLVLAEPSKQKVVRRIFREFVTDGRSMTNIADRLNSDEIKCPGFNKKPREGFEHRKKVWRFDTVKVILENPAYIGTARYNAWSYSKYHSFKNGQIVKGGRRGRNPQSDWIVHEDHHDAIIDSPTFKRAQARLAKGKTGRCKHPPESNPYLLAGKLCCGRCGGTLWGEDSERKSFECSRAKHHQGNCEGTRVREDAVLQMLCEYVETEFIPDAKQTELLRKSKRGLLKAEDLPAAFKKLKRLLVGDEPTKIDTKRIQREIDKLDSDRERGRRNLVFAKDAANIAAMESALRELDEQRAELAAELVTQPKERDINEMVFDVMKKLVWLATGKPELVKPVIRELDKITVHTTISGIGNGLRHSLDRIEVQFQQVGGVTGNSNPHLPG